VAIGNTHFNVCDAFVDNPKTGFGLSAAAAAAGTPPVPGTGSVFSFCDFDTSWLTQVKATGTYTLPWQEIQIGGVLQNLPGQQITAQWNITQAEAAAGTLGRPLSGGANTSRNVPLIEPGTMYTPRRTQLDLRVAKTIRLSGSRRLQVMADIFNAFNSNAAVGATSNAGEPPAAINTTYGSAWLRPLNIRRRVREDRGSVHLLESCDGIGRSAIADRSRPWRPAVPPRTCARKTGSFAQMSVTRCRPLRYGGVAAFLISAESLMSVVGVEAEQTHAAA
jgi:hypothetical protein